MRVLILGGDGYLGWPTALSLSRRGDRVAVLDNFSKRAWEREVEVRPLFPVPALAARIAAWEERTGIKIESYEGDLTNYEFVDATLSTFKPDVVIHYGEQPSAPFSMLDARRAALTQSNNVVGTLNVIFALRDKAPDAHLVKLGTMGEYGTPDIDIEEGYLTVTHNGRSHTFLYPKTAGSIYHLSKVHDSHNLHFAARTWGLRVTDLNQGVVYGVETDETAGDPLLTTSFHYDEIFGTVLNRFCVQAAAGHPLTIYGKGGQTRGYLNIRDTVQCVTLAIDNPAEPGELRVFNQFTEQLSILDLAEKVVTAARHLGWAVEAKHVENPRKEAETHYYNAKHEKLLALGLQPRLLSEELIDTMLLKIASHRDAIDTSSFVKHVLWAPKRPES